MDVTESNEGRAEVAVASELSDRLSQRDKARELAESALAWWDDHKTDTTGEFGEWNVYSSEPEFVKKAKMFLSGEDEPEDDA